jgi:hypothetical protein
MRIMLDRRVVRAIALAAIVAASAGAGVALAAAPIRDATYKGKLSVASSVAFPISFKVSTDGKRVGSFTFSNGYPIYCQGGGFGALQPAGATITNSGTFTVKLPIYIAPGHSHQGFVIVTGRFATHGKESGKVTTDFTHGASCNGTSNYTTKGLDRTGQALEHIGPPGESLDPRRASTPGGSPNLEPRCRSPRWGCRAGLALTHGQPLPAVLRPPRQLMPAVDPWRWLATAEH